MACQVMHTILCSHCAQIFSYSSVYGGVKGVAKYIVVRPLSGRFSSSPSNYNMW